VWNLERIINQVLQGELSMTRSGMGVQVFLAACFSLVLSSHAVAQSSTIQLYANGAVAQASSNGSYPKNDVVGSNSRCGTQTTNALPAYVVYNGPATTLYFVNAQPGLCCGLAVKSGTTVVNYEYTSGSPGSHSVEVYANGISATVQYTIKQC
jgi:hypothetical protein